MLRRDFLLDVGRLAALSATIPNDWRVLRRPRLADDPFTLGVASGDTMPDSATIWTRLAPKLYEPDGGMDGQRTVVAWEVADDEQFSKVVQKGRATAAPELGYSVHIDVPGLQADRWYFYRFLLASGAASPVGRLRTTPAVGEMQPLRFAFASCQHWEQGYYTAYDHMAAEELDLVMHLGDYVYEYAAAPGRPRQYATTEVRTLEQYRARYAQTKSDPALQKAHARAPWIITWDDHEVDNNYAGLNGENNMESEEQMRLRRAAAYQAWWEHQPVRVPRAKSWADLNIIRTFNWGALARTHVLDTRQFRSDQACGDGTKEVPCGEWLDPARTMMGPAQEKWFADGLAASRANWNIVANQVRVAPFDDVVGPKRVLGMDSWAGYPAALDRFMDAIAKGAPNRTVVISGDIHSNWVNTLHKDFLHPGTPIGAEFVGTSITSGGDGSEAFATVWSDGTRAENPFCKWHNNRRGYVSLVMTADECKASYRTVPFVSKPGAPRETPAEFVVKRGRPGIERA